MNASKQLDSNASSPRLPIAPAREPKEHPAARSCRDACRHAIKIHLPAVLARKDVTEALASMFSATLEAVCAFVKDRDFDTRGRSMLPGIAGRLLLAELENSHAMAGRSFELEGLRQAIGVLEGNRGSGFSGVLVTERPSDFGLSLGIALDHAAEVVFVKSWAAWQPDSHSTGSSGPRSRIPQVTIDALRRLLGEPENLEDTPRAEIWQRFEAACETKPNKSAFARALKVSRQTFYRGFFGGEWKGSSPQLSRALLLMEDWPNRNRLKSDT